MPRKMFRNPEMDPSMKSFERPGSGKPELSDEEHQETLGDLSLDLPREQDPSVRVSRTRVVKGYGKETKPIAQYSLEGRRDALKAQIKKLGETGGYWNEDNRKLYLETEEQLAAIDRELEKFEGKKELPVEIKEPDVTEPIQQRIQETIEEQKEIEKRREGIESELARYGIDTPAKLQAELAQITGENRPDVPRGFWEALQYRAGKISRILSGKTSLAHGTYVKTLLNSYIALENEANANIRERRNANELLAATEQSLGRRKRTQMTTAELTAVTRRGSSFGKDKAEELPEVSTGSVREVEKELELLKLDEPSEKEALEKRMDEARQRAFDVRAEATRGGVSDETFLRLVEGKEKTKDPEIALLVKGYKRAEAEYDRLNKEWMSLDVKEYENPPTVEEREYRMENADIAMQNIQSKLRKLGVDEDELNRLVVGLSKPKTKVIANLVRQYQSELDMEERMRNELRKDVRPEASMRVVAAEARAFEELEDKRRERRLRAKPVAEQQKESKELLNLRDVKEAAADIEDAIKNLEAVKDDMDVLLEKALFLEKQNQFTTRIRALESKGSGLEYDSALQAAEDALARYAVVLHRRLSRVGKEYAAPKAELVDKDISMYRTVEWRKDLLDQINADEAWRKFMHGVYEDVVARMNHLKRIEEWEFVNERLASPDPALDYTLALFRGNATRAETGKFAFPVEERRKALAEVARMDELFAWGWRYKNVQDNAESQVKAGRKKPAAGERLIKPEEVEGAPMRIDQEAAASFEASLTDQPAPAVEQPVVVEQPKVEKKPKVQKRSAEEFAEFSRLRQEFRKGAERIDTDTGILYVRKSRFETATLYPDNHVFVERPDIKENDTYTLKDYLAMKADEEALMEEPEETPTPTPMPVAAVVETPKEEPREASIEDAVNMNKGPDRVERRIVLADAKRYETELVPFASDEAFLASLRDVLKLGPEATLTDIAERIAKAKELWNKKAETNQRMNSVDRIAIRRYEEARDLMKARAKLPPPAAVKEERPSLRRDLEARMAASKKPEPEVAPELTPEMLTQIEALKRKLNTKEVPPKRDKGKKKKSA